MNEPIGDFLEAIPSMVFVSIHLIFLLIGIWAIWKANKAKLPYKMAFWLYALTQAFFLAHFGGILTLKMVVVLEQTLVVIMVIWIMAKATTSETKN